MLFRLASVVGRRAARPCSPVRINNDERQAEYVGLGSDFDGIDVAPQGLEDVTTYPDLTEVLLGRGHSEADIEKILGENFLRVRQAVTRS